MRKNLKKLTALTLTAAMTMASAMTAFAAQSASGDIATGTGGYEGGEMQYPAISVTVPTTATVDYIADPNELITKTLSGDVAAKGEYEGYKFQGNTGIYFMTKAKSNPASGDGVYSDKSEAYNITNESAQDVRLTVSLTKTKDGSGDVAYSNTGTFATTDKEKKLYLALTDGTTTEALSGDTAATLTTELVGQKDNFEPNYSGDADAYSYVKKSGDPVKAWSKAAYSLTGAVNKNAKWGDNVGFPEIKVTYSWIESPADIAPSIAKTSYAMTKDQTVEISVDLGKGSLKATQVSEANFGSSNFLGKTVSFNKATNKITVSAAAVNALMGMSGNQTLTMVFDDDNKTAVPITFTH